MRDKIVSVLLLMYIVFMSLYNLYASSFSDHIKQIFQQVYFLNTSLVLLALSGYMALNSSNNCLIVFSLTIFFHSIFLTTFNIACIIHTDRVADFVYSKLLSGISLFIIFTVSLIITFYGRLDKK